VSLGVVSAALAGSGLDAADRAIGVAITLVVLWITR